MCQISLKSSPSNLIIILIPIMLWSKYNCAKEFIWWLESLPILITLPILIITYRKFHFTNLCYYLLFIHAVILLIRAHYTYEQVPFFNYLKQIFNLTHNHYDRIGHFAQGFIPAIVARELLLRTSSIKKGKWLTAIVILSILGISSLYEIFEWLTAIGIGESASSFLATQGDPWDTQKDMALAGIGASIALITLSKYHNLKLANLKNNKL